MHLLKRTQCDRIEMSIGSVSQAERALTTWSLFPWITEVAAGTLSVRFRMKWTDSNMQTCNAHQIGS